MPTPVPAAGPTPIASAADPTPPPTITRARDGAYVLRAECWLDADLATVFAFHADARNLEGITPPWMRFAIQTPGPIPMAEGTVIDYRLAVHGVPLRWRTRITAWDPPHGFADDQVRGPYRRWEHRHAFVERDGGTVVIDEVRYAVPTGRLAHALFVRRDVLAIFRFRQAALRARAWHRGAQPAAVGDTVSATNATNAAARSDAAGSSARAASVRG